MTHGKNTLGERSPLWITPLYSQAHNLRRSRRTLFPIWWHKEYYNNSDTTVYNHIAPIYWSKVGKKDTNRVLFPLIWSLNDSRTKSFTIPALFHKKESADGEEKHLVVTPFFHHKKNSLETKNTLFPIWWQGTKKIGRTTVEYNHVAPLFWSRKSEKFNNTVLFPIMWNLKDKQYRSLTLFPFFSSGKSSDDKASHLWVTPLFQHRETSRGSRTTFFPIWWNGENTKNGKSEKFNHIAPLYWSRTSDTKKNRVLFPLIWSFRNEQRRSFTVPFLYHQKKSADGKRAHTSITPLFHQKRTPNSMKNTLFPIWWQGNDSSSLKTKKYNHIAPLYWSKESSEFNNKVLFPIMWSLKDKEYRSLTLFPFFSSGTSLDKSASHLWITPLFQHRETDRGNRTTFFPIWWKGMRLKNQRPQEYNHVLPLYWSTKNDRKENDVLFPIIWSFKNKQYKSLTVFPLFSTGKSSDSSRKHKMITPLYLNKEAVVKKDTTKSTVLFPLYWSFKTPSKNSTVIFPFVWDFDKDKNNDSAYSVFTVPALFSFGESDDDTRRRLMIASLFWHSENLIKKRTALYPLFRYEEKFDVQKKFNLLLFMYRYNNTKGRVTHDALWPLISSTRDTDYHKFRISPLVWYKKDMDSKMAFVAPLFYYKRDESDARIRFLWQLYSFNGRDGYKKEHSVLWRAWRLSKYDNGDREFRIFYQLYTNMRKEGKVERGVFPFFRFKRDDEGNRTLGVLFNFYQSTTKKLDNCNDFYREQRIFWFIRIRSNYDLLSEECQNDVSKK